jgi:hypothetical protein
MDNDKKFSTINRITTGIVYLNIKETIYRLRQPTQSERALSELVYRETLNNSKFEELITRDQASAILHKRRIWTTEHDQQYEDLIKYLDDLKASLYRALYNEKEQKQLRRKIASVRKGLEKNLHRKYSFDYMTLENHAEITRDEFLTAICIENNKGEPVYTYENYNKADNYILQRFLNFLIRNIITVEEYREMARTDPFRGMWIMGQAEVFGVPVCNLSMDQRSLIMYSRMYDNVYENHERPSDDVIDDDDMLDGWFVIERRKAEKDRKKQEIEKLLAKKGIGGADNGAGEMFVMANTETEASKIRELNDLNTRMRMQQRKKALDEKGRLEEHQLPDVQMELQNEARRQIADRKGK